MQRFSLFSQPSLSLVEQSRFFRFTRTCDATREFIPSKTTKAGEESREVLSSSLGPNRGSPLYRKPKRLLREATSRVLDKTARLRATVSSYSFFSFLFFRKWRICAKRARKGKKLGIGGDVSRVHRPSKTRGRTSCSRKEQSSHPPPPDKASKPCEKKETVDRPKKKKKHILALSKKIESRDKDCYKPATLGMLLLPFSGETIGFRRVARALLTPLL